MEQDVAWLSVEGGLMGVVSGVFVGVAIVVVVKKGLCHKRLLSKRLLLLSKKVKLAVDREAVWQRQAVVFGSGVWWCAAVAVCQQCAPAIKCIFLLLGKTFQKL